MTVPPEIEQPVPLYIAILALHSWIRWVAIFAGAGALIAVWRSRTSEIARGRWGLFLTIALDVQLLLGLLLYFFVSPMTTVAMRNWTEAMRNPWVRFFMADHVVIMLAAVVIVHAGRVLARKAATPEARRVRLWWCFGLALILMMAATPWPGRVAGRPLFRHWGIEVD